jgi:catalase
MTGEDILFWKNVYVETGFEVQKTWGALAAIAVVAGTLASAFAWTAGWLGSRTVSQALVGETPKPFPPGFRRAHGKGICFAGTFTPNGSADSLSTSRLFSQQEVPVVGRFSIGTGDPHAPDSTTKTLSMALLLKTDDKQQWRMAMNNEPFFATHSPEGFLALRKATAVDAATGNRIRSVSKTF